MQNLFNYDNPVWRFIGKLGDLIMLNLLWIICSIPVFTLGASTTAVYYVTLKMVRDEEDGVFRGFFRSFTSNFKQATAIWLILLAASAIIGFDFWFFYTGQAGTAVTGTMQTVLTAVFGGAILILVFVALYVFPLQARFYNPVKKTLFNAFFMSVRHLVQTLGILVADVAVVGGIWLSLYYVPQVFILFVLMGMPLIAFLNSYFFEAVFKRYMPSEERENGEVKPLFEEEDAEVEEAFRSLKGESDKK